MNTEKPLSDAISFDDDYFIKNAILCFLHYYPNHKWVPIYQGLMDRETIVKTPPDARKPRPARRRKPKSSQSSD